MTQDEFDETFWLNGMKCTYDSRHREVMCVDFFERLIGLHSLSETGDIDWVRCENVSDVAKRLLIPEDVKKRLAGSFEGSRYK